MHHTDRNAHNAWSDPRSRAPVAVPRRKPRASHPLQAGLILAITIAAGWPMMLDSLAYAWRLLP